VKRRAAHARNLWRAALNTLYRIEVHGRDNVVGARVICFTDGGPLTIPALRTALPRPVHVLGADIDVDRPGIAAVQRGLEALRSGALVAGHAEDPVLVFLVARSGADICPAAVHGAHGRIPTDPPRPGQRVQVTFGAPVSTQRRASTLAGVQAAREQVRQVMSDHARVATAGRGAA